MDPSLDIQKKGLRKKISNTKIGQIENNKKIKPHDISGTILIDFSNYIKIFIPSKSYS